MSLNNYHELCRAVSATLHHPLPDNALRGKLHPVTSLPPDAAQAALVQSFSSGAAITLTTGCGLPSSLDELPLRFPALLVPGLEMMRRYQSFFGGGGNLSYHVYQAGAFIKRVNGTPLSEATPRFMQDYLARFVGCFYPDLAPRISFDFKKDASDEELEPVVHFLRDIKNGAGRDALHQIGAYASRGAGRGCAMTYTAANIHFNLLEGRSPGLVIPIGGQKEAPFFHLTSHYDLYCNGGRASVLPLCFSAQNSPPYYAYRHGDLTIGTLFNENGDITACDPSCLGGPARKDFNALLEPIGATLAELAELARQSHRALALS